MKTSCIINKLVGENNEFGLMQDGFNIKVVKPGENGITEKDILVHDAHYEDNTLQLKLAMMDGPDFPIALGVIRDVAAPTYDDAGSVTLLPLYICLVFLFYRY